MKLYQSYAGGCERRRDPREFEYQRGPARFQHAAHFREGVFLARDVAQAKGDRHAIERTARKRQRLGIALDGGQHDAGVEQPVAAGGEHRAVDVGMNHPSAVSDALRKQPREIAGAAGEIEDTRAGPRAGHLDRKALPQPV